jgi:hypothetical protein
VPGHPWPAAIGDQVPEHPDLMCWLKKEKLVNAPPAAVE